MESRVKGERRGRGKIGEMRGRMKGEGRWRYS